jgi:predicted transcriptional regulator
MLSPHEYSTLMLINSQSIDVAREEVQTLVHRRLVTIDTDQITVRITALGNRFLEALSSAGQSQQPYY